MSELAPVPPRERVMTLDVLRGFALCGVLIGNMVLYSGRWAERGAASDPTALDQVARWFLVILVDGKAQTLLTLLFGFGFAVQLLRAEERREPVMGLYVRRLTVLFLLGVLHVTLLWWGDVIWTYGVAGFGLLLFVRLSNRARVGWAIALIFIPSVVMSIPEVWLAGLRVFIEPAELAASTARMGQVLQREERAGLASEHVRYALIWNTQIYVWYYLWTLGRFLLGYVAGKLRWFDRDGADHLPVFRRMAVWGGAVAAFTTAFAIAGRTGWLPIGEGARPAVVVFEQVGLLAMTFAYVGVTVLLLQRPAWRRVLGVLAPVGRMPLTTYFSQSLICTFLFYGWGLGWAGSVGVPGCVGLAFAIFAVQIAICHLWLRAFRFGPLEWVWRTAVYLKLQPMRPGSRP